MTDQNLELTDLSPELLCKIFQYLPLRKVLCLSVLSQKMLCAVKLHLRLRKSVDFCESKISAFMPSSITDDSMQSLFKKCPQLEIVYGLNPRHVERRRFRNRSALTVPGIIDALSICPYLKAIESSDIKLLEAIMQYLPHLEIRGLVQTRNVVFPPRASQRLQLQPCPKITSLNLFGVEVPELTAMPHLQHLRLQFVRFTKPQPFRAFTTLNLQTFVMKHCVGPSLSLRYLSLIMALSSSVSLRCLELVNVPLTAGLLQRAVEDSYRNNGFVNLTTVILSGCKGIVETDIGHLLIVASKNIEHLYIPPSLTKDSLFVSLSFAHCSFPKLKTLYLGYVDESNTHINTAEWNNEALMNYGLPEAPDTPASLTDCGMKVIGELFPALETLSVVNCPHLILMDQWSQGEAKWKKLLDLTLQRCHCLRLSSFSSFISTLPKIEVIILVDMFREPPKGCSHVGLSAGTGLGMSSAVVSNQDEHIAVQGHLQEFDLDNFDLEGFVELEENAVVQFPPHHIMVLLEQEMREAHPDIFRERRFFPEGEHFVDPDIENNVVNDTEDHQAGQNEDAETVAVDKPNDNCAQTFSPNTSKLLNYKESSSNSDTSSTDDEMYSSISEESCNSVMSQKSKRKNQDLIDNSQSGTKSKKKCSMQTSCDTESCISPERLVCRCCDPNQPSTSTATCNHNFNASADNNKRECNSYSDVKVNEIVESSDAMGFSLTKVKQEIYSDEEKECETESLKKDSKTFLEENNFYTGPMTRQRKKLLGGEAGIVPDSFNNKGRKTNGQKRRKTQQTYKACALSSGNEYTPLQRELLDEIEREKDTDKVAAELYSLFSRTQAYKKETDLILNSSAANNPKLSEFSAISQGTQTTSEDIGHDFKEMKNERKPSRKSLNNRRKKSSYVKYSAISRRAKHKFKRILSSTTAKSDVATSTSDPLLEEDAEQVLRLVSRTLRSLTIVSCGLSDLVINPSRQLHHIEVQACRILKSIRIYCCIALKRFNISECPKLSFESIYSNMLKLQTEGHLMVSFEPWKQKFDPGEIESALFYDAHIDQNIILCEDYTEIPEEINETFVKNRLFTWMDSLDSLVHLFAFNYKEPKIRFDFEDPLNFPWRHDLRRIVGIFDQEIPEHKKRQINFDIVTNNLVFASAIELFSWEKGFPKPERSTLFANLGLLCEELKKVAKLDRTIKAFYFPVNKC